MPYKQYYFICINTFTLIGDEYMNLPRIRSALNSDIEKIKQIYFSTVTWMSNNNHKQWRYTDIKLLFEIFEIAEFFVYEYNAEILGVIIISEKDISHSWEKISFKKKSLYLYRLVIGREYAKKGYAKDLLDFAKNYGFSHGFEQLCLLCLKRKTKLVQFYLDNDFFNTYETIIQTENEPSIFFVHNLSIMG